MKILRTSRRVGQLQATMGLAFPLIVSNLAQMATHLTDTVMMGWYGIAELAAVVLGATMFHTIFLVGSGFAMAVMPLAAEAEGARDLGQVRRVVRMGFWMSMIFGTVSLIPMIFSEPVLIALGQQLDTAALASRYITIAMWGIFPALTIMLLKSFFLAVIRPRIVLWSTVVGAVSNAFADYALIFGKWGFPELGVEGAAIASVSTQFFSLFIMLVYIERDAIMRSYSLFTRIWRIDTSAFRSVFMLGWPIGVTLIAETGMFAATALMMGWIDTESLAAHGIALQVAAFFFMIYLGFANASTAQLGRAVGARDMAAFKGSAEAAVIWTLISIALTVAILVTIPETLVLAFLEAGTDPESRIVRIGVALLYIGAVFQIWDALQVVGLGLLRGLSDTRVPMLIAAFSYWGIGLPLCYVLGFVLDFGGPGIWWGLTTGLAIAAFAFFVRFRKKARELDLSAQ